MAGIEAYIGKYAMMFETNNCAGLANQKDPEATAGGCLIFAFFDWMCHGFK